jgi:hypothetical protein
MSHASHYFDGTGFGTTELDEERRAFEDQNSARAQMGDDQLSIIDMLAAYVNHE